MYPEVISVGGRAAVRKHPVGFALAILTLLAGGFICVAGLYAIIDALVEQYASGAAGQPFGC